MDYRRCSKCGQWHGIGDFCIDSMSRSIAAQIEGRNYCSSCESLLKEQANLQRQILQLKERLKPQIDTVEGIPTGYGEDEIDRLQSTLSHYREAIEKTSEEVGKDVSLALSGRRTIEELWRRIGDRK